MIEQVPETHACGGVVSPPPRHSPRRSPHHPSPASSPFSFFSFSPRSLLVRWVGKRPVAHSTRLSPKDQTSESNEYAPPLILSGDMYVTVPTQLLHLVTLLASCPLTPKSESLASPARLTNTLLGLTSLCTTLASSWRYRSASSICAANPQAGARDSSERARHVRQRAAVHVFEHDGDGTVAEIRAVVSHDAVSRMAWACAAHDDVFPHLRLDVHLDHLDGVGDARGGVDGALDDAAGTLTDDAEDLELLEDDVEGGGGIRTWTRGRTSQRDRRVTRLVVRGRWWVHGKRGVHARAPPPSRELPREPSGMAERGNPSPARGSYAWGPFARDAKTGARDLQVALRERAAARQLVRRARHVRDLDRDGRTLTVRGIVRVARRRLRRARECAASTRRRR